MKLKLTRFERSWLRILGLLSFVLLAVFMVRPLLPANKTESEPLADAKTLRLLMNGDQPPVPTDVSEAQFHGQRLSPPKVASLIEAPTRVLGDTTANKHIEVDLAHQRVYAFEGNSKVYDFPVSTGKWGRTPTGTFYIWTKIKSTLMTGGDQSIGTYYYLPNVPWVMFFYNNEVSQSRGYSLHGTYWHNNFGHPMSHGCVNMRIADAKVIFDWARPVVTNPKAWSTLATNDNPGTRIVIYGDPPKD